ncbi:MAG: TonB-dependent receptor [Idiomarina sp.]
MIKLSLKQPALTFGAGCFFFWGGNFSAIAQQSDVPDSVDERIVVTATQTERSWFSTPASVSNVSTSEQLPGLRIDAAELLGGIAGLQADSRANYAQDTRIVMRGFGARSAFGVRGVLLTLDGIPLSMPDGQAQTSSILLDEPDNVEVLRGPLAALYGNGAGGVIAWRSRMPTQRSVTLNAMVAEHDTNRALLQGSWVDSSQTHALELTAARFRTDGPRAHNSAERDQLALRWHYQVLNNTRLVLRLDENDAPLLQDPGALTPADWREDPEQTFGGATTFNTRKRILHQQASLSLQNDSASPWYVNAWRGEREVEQYLPFPGSDPTSSGAVIDLAREFSGINAQYTQPVLENVDVSVGAELEKQTDTRRGYVNDFGERGELRRDEVGRVETFDGYALADWQVARDWNLIAGVRYSDLSFAVDDNYITAASPDDSGERTDNALAWSFAANHQLTDEVTVFAAYGRSFAAPTLTEMAYRNEGSGLNTALAPSFNRQSELGLKWRINASDQLSLSAFHIDTKDTLLVDQSNDGRTTYRNAGETTRYGVEVEAQWALTQTLNSRFSAHFLDASFGDDQPTAVAGRRIPGIAERSAFWKLDWQLPVQLPLTLSLVTDYRSDIAATDSNDVIAPGRTVFHAALTGQFNTPQWRIEPWLRVDNLTDKQYVGAVVVNQGSGRAFEPAPGITASAGIEFKRMW